MLDAFSNLGLSDVSASSPLEDITEKYFHACHSLALGELICTDDFQLQDSIAALEIMDPKMDNGVIDAMESNEVPYDCSRPLNPTEVLSIMDQMFASEMSWHTGSSLSQTLYTCVYLQKTLGKTLPLSRFSNSSADAEMDYASKLLDSVLFPYVVATVKCSEFIREEYMTGYLYEEEDVSSTDYGLELLPMLDSQIVVEMLREGIEWLARQNDVEKSAELEQLHVRLSMRFHFYRMCQNLETASEWPDIIRALLDSYESLSFANSPVSDLQGVFNTKIQRTLISTSPPRPIMSITIVQAYEEFKRACFDLLRILPITSEVRSSPANMLSFFNYIRKTHPPTLPLVRSRMQNLLLEDKQAQHHANKLEFLIRAIEETIAPRPDIFDLKYAAVEIPTDVRHSIHSIVTSTLSRLELPFLDYFKILCHNPGRQRRNLIKILADFDVLQIETEQADQTLASLLEDSRSRQARTKHHPKTALSITFPISSWILSTKFDICILILFNGFETELYRPFEWCMIYYHLDTFLSLQFDHLSDIALNLDRPTPMSSNLSTRFDNTRSWLTFRILRNEALSILCKAYECMTFALTLLNCIRYPILKFSSSELLYRSRFLPFSKLISPPPIAYTTWIQETLNMKTSVHQSHQNQVLSSSSSDAEIGMAILNQSTSLFALARTKLTHLSKRDIPRDPGPGCIPALEKEAQLELRELVGCCIANHLMVNNWLKAGIDSFAGKQVVPKQGRFSRHFPSIELR